MIRVPVSISDILDSAWDIIGILFVVSGFVLLFIAAISVSPINQWISVAASFAGAVLLVSGLAIRIEGPPSLKTPSRSGLGTILIYISLVIIASAGICILFATPEGIFLVMFVLRGIQSEYVRAGFGSSSMWLVIPLFTAGLSLLSIGVLLKFSETYEKPNVKELKLSIFKIKKSPLSIVGTGIIIFFVAVALLAPVLAPPGDPSQEGDPFKMPRDGNSKIPQPPSSKHPFGTLSWQFDLYYGCIWGTVHAFYTGMSVVFSALAIGLAVGITAGYCGGYIDDLLMMLTNIILAVPGLMFVMIFVSTFTQQHLLKGEHALLLALILSGSFAYARVIRAEVLRVKTEDYIEAAGAVGCSNLRLVFRHILPNAIYPIIIMASLDIGSVVLTIASVNFLGIGSADFAQSMRSTRSMLTQGHVSWGNIIFLARNDAYFSPVDPLHNFHTFFIPGLFIFFFVLGWNLLGDALRDVLDPTIRRK